MQHEEVLKIGRLAVARDDAIGGHAHLARPGILDRLRDGEHVVLVDLHRAREDQALAIVPPQSDGLAGRKRAARGEGPFGVRAGNIFVSQIAAGGPAVEGVVGTLLPHRAEQTHEVRRRLQRDAVVLELQVVDPPARERDRALDPRRVDGEAGGFGRGLGCGGCVGGNGFACGRRGCRFGRRGDGGGRGRGNGFGWREQDEPDQDHHEAEARREKKIFLF